MNTCNNLIVLVKATDPYNGSINISYTQTISEIKVNQIYSSMDMCRKTQKYIFNSNLNFKHYLITDENNFKDVIRN